MAVDGLDPSEPPDVPPDRPLASQDPRAPRLGSALHRMAAALVAERERVKQLVRENRELRARLEAKVERDQTRTGPRR
jgi:hypothetical protein